MSLIWLKNIKIIRWIDFLRALAFDVAIVVVFLQRRVSIEEVSMLFAWQYFVQMMAEMPTGALADILGRKVTIVFGFMVSGILYLLLPSANVFWHLVLVFAGLGVSDALVSGSEEALLYDSLKQDGVENKYSEIAAKNSFVFQIGLVIATILGGFLFTINQALPYILTGLSCLITGFVALLLIEPVVDSEKFTWGNYLNQMRLGWKEIHKSLFVKRFAGYYILVGGISWAGMLYFNQALLVDLGFGDSQRGLISGGLRLINVFVLVRLLKNEKVFTRKVSYWFFPIIMIVAFLPGMLLNGWWAVPFVALAMMSSTARWIVLGKIANEEFESKYRATALSVLSMLVGVVYVILTVLSGPIMSNFGGTKTVYSLLGVLCLVTVLPLAVRLAKRHS